MLIFASGLDFVSMKFILLEANILGSCKERREEKNIIGIEIENYFVSMTSEKDGKNADAD